MTIRAETPRDAAAIHAVNAAAFPTPAEADLVDRLRAAGALTVSLAAESDGRVVGAIAFSPVTIDGSPTQGLGLAPVAVHPDRRQQGIGSALIRSGLEECRVRGAAFVVVLGEPEFYSRFGFAAASRFGLSNEYGVDEPFQAMELRSGALEGVRGLVRYHAEFAKLV